MKLNNPVLLIAIVIGLGMVFLGLSVTRNSGSPKENLSDSEPASTVLENSPDSMIPLTEPPPSDIFGDDTANIDMPIPIIQIEVDGDEFRFSPSTIRVARGSTVELMFNNVGSAPHNYAIDELGVLTRTIGGGESDLVIFEAPDAPTTITYTSYCTIPGHLEAGMEGELIVE